MVPNGAGHGQETELRISGAFVRVVMRNWFMTNLLVQRTLYVSAAPRMALLAHMEDMAGLSQQ